jgi:hypothetical protein
VDVRDRVHEGVRVEVLLRAPYVGDEKRKRRAVRDARTMAAILPEAGVIARDGPEVA